MYKHILVAVDGSSTSDLALQAAVKLAQEQQARLRLVHVVDVAVTDRYREFEPPEDLFESIHAACAGCFSPASQRAWRVSPSGRFCLSEAEAWTRP